MAKIFGWLNKDTPLFVNILFIASAMAFVWSLSGMSSDFDHDIGGLPEQVMSLQSWLETSDSLAEYRWMVTADFLKTDSVFKWQVDCMFRRSLNGESIGRYDCIKPEQGDIE